MLKKIVLTLFTAITLAVVAILTIAATRPNTYHVERSQSMGASPGAVYAVLNDLHRFHEWSPWQKLDPNMKVTYGGPDTGVGSSYSWVGNKEAGEGRMTITESTAPSSVTQKLEFMKPFESTCAVHLAIAPEGEGSRVTWAIDGNYNYMSKVMCMFVSMDSMMGKDFEAGLTKLKEVAEAAPAPPASAASPETETATKSKP